MSPNTADDETENVLDHGLVPSATVKSQVLLPAEYWNVVDCDAVIVVVPAFKTVTSPLDESTVATVVSLLVYEIALPSVRELVAVKLNDKSGTYVLEMAPSTYASLARVIVVVARFTLITLVSIYELAY